ncbi:unc-22, partial [Symbiodinium sp. KB8]
RRTCPPRSCSTTGSLSWAPRRSAPQTSPSSRATSSGWTTAWEASSPAPTMATTSPSRPTLWPRGWCRGPRLPNCFVCCGAQSPIPSLRL